MPLVFESFDGLLWLLLLLGPLLLVQRVFHREIQAVLLLITRRPDMTIAIFSLLFIPGVVVHESSHYLMAKILGVPTGKISLLPESLDGNRIRLGFVETGNTDFIRDALIGMAPLLVGGLIVAYAGVVRLDFLSLWDGLSSGDLEDIADRLSESFSIPDFWLWFYLTVAVSSTMLPSTSDRKAWLPVALIGVLIAGLALLFGAGPWMSENLLPVLNEALRGVAVVFAISIGVLMLVLFPTWIIRKILNRVTGLQVNG